MADYTGTNWTIDEQAKSGTPAVGVLWGESGGGVSYYQRVYSTSAGWCYYTVASIVTSPAAGATTPNHANDLVAGRHSVIAVI